MDPGITDNASVYRQAIVMARDMQTQLFDTMYHAVAIQASAPLVAADERYYWAAHAHGRIELLQSWRR